MGWFGNEPKLFPYRPPCSRSPLRNWRSLEFEIVKILTYDT